MRNTSAGFLRMPKIIDFYGFKSGLLGATWDTSAVIITIHLFHVVYVCQNHEFYRCNPLLQAKMKCGPPCMFMYCRC